VASLLLLLSSVSLLAAQDTRPARRIATASGSGLRVYQLTRIHRLCITLTTL
jgi:hypothetical protein